MKGKHSQQDAAAAGGGQTMNNYGGMNNANLGGGGMGMGNNLRQQLLRRRNGLLTNSDLLGRSDYGYGDYGGGGYGGPVSIVSGFGGGGQCDQGINPLLALLTLAGAAVGFYYIYIKLTMSGRRRSFSGSYLENVAETLWLGK